MLQQISGKHDVDGSGNPAGGTTTGTGISVSWQNGPLGRGAERKAPNGAFVEDVLAAVIGRIECYQDTQFNCQENADALSLCLQALARLQDRTRNREARGVEGTHAK